MPIPACSAVFYNPSPSSAAAFHGFAETSIPDEPGRANWQLARENFFLKLDERSPNSDAYPSSTHTHNP